MRTATSSKSRMVLLRFSDAIRELPESWSIQIHRSHWVAYSAVQELKKDSQSMKLELAGDQLVPVSRFFRSSIEDSVLNKL